MAQNLPQKHAWAVGCEAYSPVLGRCLVATAHFEVRFEASQDAATGLGSERSRLWGLGISRLQDLFDLGVL